MNYCTSCRRDFAAVRAFDAHRVGKHAYTYSEGLKLNPPREDGRRCLHQTEMVERGFAEDTRGRWVDPLPLHKRSSEGCYSPQEATRSPESAK